MSEQENTQEQNQREETLRLLKRLKNTLHNAHYWQCGKAIDQSEGAILEGLGIAETLIRKHELKTL